MPASYLSNAYVFDRMPFVYCLLSHVKLVMTACMKVVGVLERFGGVLLPFLTLDIFFLAPTAFCQAAVVNKRLYLMTKGGVKIKHVGDCDLSSFSQKC